MTGSFLSELRRRNVLRAGAFYAAAGWLLVQIATQVFPFFDIPNWVVRWVVMAVITGFPFALVFSWFYELTPQGFKRDSEVEHSDASVEAAGRRIDRWIMAALSVAIVLLLANQFVLHRDADLVIDKSIAVLPFENLSEDKANAYFAVGIQDEILTRLAKIGALKVISRTSTQQYAARPGNLSSIAKELGVANVLEGSVQRTGDTVRVTVQLIKAASDNHLWAESYNRKLDDVFGVESEVAGAIAETLNAKLNGGEQQALADAGTANPAAHDAYLRGLSIGRRIDPGSHEVPLRAREFFSEAVRLDPQYALAWAHLSIVESYMCFNAIDATPELLEDAKQAADKALALRPQMGEAFLALGYYRYWGLRDLDGGLRAFEQARQRLPNDVEVLGSLGLIERRRGNWQIAIAHTERAVSLDPRNPYWLPTLASYYIAMRRYNDAQAALDRALNILPDDPGLLATKVTTYQAQGNLDAAQKLLDSMPSHPEDAGVLQVRIQQLLYLRRYREVIDLWQSASARAKERSWVPFLPSLITTIGWAQVLSGDRAKAHATFVEAIDMIKAQPPTDMNGSINTFLLAFAYAGSGDKEAALREANRAVSVAADDALLKPQAETALAEVEIWCDKPDVALAALPHLLEVPGGLPVAFLKIDPAWDPVREDPRFQKLVATYDMSK
jgi:TolB-like protein/Tfp pilus assembly protein PilF